MRKFKRALCSLLAIVMCLGMLPTAAFAADPDSPPYEGDHSGSITVTARDTVTGDLLDGVTFQLEDITAGRFFTYEQKTTTASGSVTWTGLSSGTYRVTQTDVPDDYILETHMKTVYLDTTVQKDYPIEFRNQAEAALYIYRFDPDPATGFKPLAGAQFKVQNTQTQEVFTGTTNDQGYLVIPNIPDGEYLITETKAPEGYNETPNSRTIKIVAGNDIPYVVEFCGDELSSITIINRDISTLEPIAGSHWKITDADGSTIYNDLVTNSAGLAYAPNLEPGTYVIQQTRVANGYIEELQSTDDAIFKACGYDPLYIRPPFGAMSDVYQNTVDRDSILWTIDTRDWESHDASKIKKIIDTYVSDGSIILLHDIHEDSVKAMKSVIPELLEKGYQLVTVSDLYKYGRIS